ncbi:MAG: STAS domain-containing protein [Fibrobacteria bacterium]|nr:STAS domain-containing protein [Fibrobacteria bacterium]
MSNQLDLQMSDSNSVPQTKIFAFNGDLDSTNATTTLNTIKTTIESGFVNIVADFKHLRYLNSMGLGILIHLSKIAKEKGGCFRVVRINDNILDIIQLIGAHTIIDIHPNLEDALNAICEQSAKD